VQPFSAIDHVQLAMPAGREDDARAFFLGVLGMTEVPKPPDLAKRGGCWFSSASRFTLRRLSGVARALAERRRCLRGK